MTSNKGKQAADSAFDSAAFASALQAAVDAEKAGQRYGATGALLRETIPLLHADALASSDLGDKIAARLARTTDDVLKILFAAAPDFGGEIAICAVGGYGRRTLAPFSDIDLLFLHSASGEEAVKAATDYMLYPLWDSGLKIGHGVHTTKSAIEFVKGDMVGRTAYLDARLLCGSKKLFNDFQSAYDRLRWGTKNQFVAAKLKEQAERQEAAGETRYLVEPDLKNGKGGLRDLQTIQWIYKYVYGGAIGERKKIDKILDASDLRALKRAEKFLWSVRVHLHDLRGRVDDHLAFDVQPAIAARLNYADRKNMSAAERLMKHYFVNAVEVGRLTRVLCAKLEAERTKRIPHLPTLLPKELQADEAPGKPNLRIRNGRLDFQSAAKAKRTPRDFFRLFRAFSKKPKIDFHPDALAIVAEHAPLVTSDVRNDKHVAALFAAILTEASDPARVLEIMTETGLLGKYVNAYGAIVGRIHYGLYRRYTLNEHVLRSIGVLARIKRGALKDEHPIATKIVKRSKSKLLYFVAVLLHEAIWTVKDKSLTLCEKLVQRVALRLGLDKEEAALAGWAVAHHLLLVRTAERRNLSDARAIINFAEAVGSRERLDLILVMSICQLRVLGLNTWGPRMRRNITELYEASLVWFDEGEEAVRRRLVGRAAAARMEVLSRLEDWTDEDKTTFLDQLTDEILRTIDPELVVRFAYLAQAAQKDGVSAAAALAPRDGELEAIVYADDRPGLLADIAGAIAAGGFEVRSVQVLTTTDGKAFDVFTIGSADGAVIEDASQTKRLHEALLAAARAAPTSPPQLRRRFGDRRSIFSVAPNVRFELEASEHAAVVETEGLDRPGLLYELAGSLTDLGVSIASAHIATYGERAVDAFYLCDPETRTIPDAKVLRAVEKKLMDVLSAGYSG